MVRKLFRSQRKSKYKWPNHKIPTRWWKLWSTYITTILTPYLRSHKLGKQISLPHQESIWKLSTCKKFVSGGETIYKRCETSKYRSRYASYTKCKVMGRVHTHDNVDVKLRRNKLISRYNREVNLPRIKVVTPIIPSQVVHENRHKKDS